MNKFLGWVIFVLKVVVCLFLVLLAASFRGNWNQWVFVLGAFLMWFVALVTIFLWFFGKGVVTRWPKLRVVLRVLAVVDVILILCWVALLSYGVPKSLDKQKSQAAAGEILAHKITLLDVFGNNLPAKPDQKVNDSTVAGVDTNKNFIRDDVELAIFSKYPNSAKIRAAELQYAQALQLELTQVFSSGTLVATLQKGSKAINCLGETGPKVNLNDSHEKILADYAVSDNWQKETRDLVLNTNMRKNKQEDVLNQYLTTYSSITGEPCDIIPSSLEN